MKYTPSNIKNGIDLISSKLDSGYSYIVPNVVELTFESFSSKKDDIGAAIDYIRMTGSDSAIFRFVEDRVNDTATVQMSLYPVLSVIKNYNALLPTKLFDGRRTTKEINCIDANDAKEKMVVALALCKFGFYGGYSYDYSTQLLTVF